MQFIKVSIGEKEGGNSCLSVLPPVITDPASNIRSEIIQCSCLSYSGGCSIIRITDPDRVLSDEISDRRHYTGERGDCIIDRISSHQFTAMVMNNNCNLSRIVSESGCFITSAVLESEKSICWTIVGPERGYIRNLMERLDSEGYTVKKESSFISEYDTVLSDRQEEAVRTALDRGFYEIPRRIKMDGLCDELNCSKSTLDVTLRNAEKKIISHYFSYNRNSLNEKHL